MAQPDQLQARVFLRPLGVPMTVGLSGLFIASLVQGGFDLGWIAKAERQHVGLILVSIPFLLQLIACVLAYLARDGATGAALGVLATTWLALGVVHIGSAPGATSGALGLALAASGGLLVLIAAAVAVLKPLPALVFTLAGSRFALAGVHELGGGSGWAHAAGAVSLVVTVLAGYCVVAYELEGQHHRPILPTLRRGTARDAIDGDAAAQLEGIVNEAGVRQTT